MRLAILFCLLITNAVHAQRALPEAKKEIDGYKKELQMLKEAYQEAVVKARTNLDLKLSEIAKKHAEAGNADKARKVELEKTKLHLANSVEKRLDLQNDITGRLYKFDAKNWILKFDSDGYIYVPLRGHEHKRFPWVALTSSEVLYMNELGKLAVINFSTDRKSFDMKIFEPQKGSGNLKGTRIK